MGCITDNRKGCKGYGSSAVGYWGRDIYKRLVEDQTVAKERVDLQDMIMSTGVRAELWTAVKTGTKCKCYKESNKASDRKCKSCHGVIDGFVPGYVKFGFETLWMSASDSDITLTNMEVTNTFKSSKAWLTDGSTTGTIESGDKAFTRNAIGSTWETDVSTFVRIAASSSVVVEYSLNSGLTWIDIAQLSVVNPSVGVIRFRATLTRTTSAILSPLFEIVRARYSHIPYEVNRPDGNYTWGPWIRVMRGSPTRKYTKSEYGDFLNMGDVTFWTTGLSFFDQTLVKESDQEWLEGPNVKIKLLDGVLAGKFFAMNNWQTSDPAGYKIVAQTFKMVPEDLEGPAYLIW